MKKQPETLNEVVQVMRGEDIDNGVTETINRPDSLPIIPILTSNSGNPNFIASANGEAVGFLAFNAFDGNPSTSWQTSGPTPATLQITLTTAIAVSSYTVVCDPDVYTLQGSFDGANWITLDVSSAPSAGIANKPCNNVGRMKFYRLFFQALDIPTVYTFQLNGW